MGGSDEMGRGRGLILLVIPVRIFFMILIPKTTPSKMAMPVLNERMSESALLAAGARGENISRVVAVIARF